jgi:hypothetical protein
MFRGCLQVFRQQLILIGYFFQGLSDFGRVHIHRFSAQAFGLRPIELRAGRILLAIIPHPDSLLADATEDNGHENESIPRYCLSDPTLPRYGVGASARKVEEFAPKLG